MAFVKIEDGFMDEVSEAKVSNYEAVTGTYVAKIKKAFGFQSDSGAKAVRIEFDLTQDQETGEELENPISYKEDFYIVSGDEKGNKTTFTTKKGKEVPLPAWGVLKSIAKSAGFDLKKAFENTVDAKEQVYADEQTVAGMPDIKGVLIIGLKKNHDTYNDDIGSEIGSTLPIEAKDDEVQELVATIKKYNDKFKIKEKKIKENKEKKSESKEKVKGW
jgi:hypothetical protein